MKKIFLLLLPVIFLLTGCGSTNAGKKLVIGIDDDFAPMSFYNERNELVGFEIDLAQEACSRMGVTAEFKPIDWSNKRNEITSGGVDMIWNGLDITEKRKEYMIFSKPYMDDRKIVLVAKDSDLSINSEYDLADKIVGSQSGSASDDYLKQHAELKDTFKEYKAYGKQGEGVAALNRGEIEIFVCDELVARYETCKQPDKFKIINVRVGDITETGIGFPKDKTELRAEVQAAFDEMIADGTAKEISEKWFKADLIKGRK